MTATFKVVEFYRNNNHNNNNNINNSINTSNAAADDTMVDVTKLPPALIPSFNLIYGTLGFNVLGGYLTDIPATVIDVAVNSSGKSAKVYKFGFKLKLLIFCFFGFSVKYIIRLTKINKILFEIINNSCVLFLR